MADREGPRVAVHVTTACGGCKHHSTERFVQSHPAVDHYATKNYCGLLHGTRRVDIGESTPKECPFLAAEVDKALLKKAPATP